MTRKIRLGAPSLTGKDANDLVAEAFADAKYPLKLEVTNLMPRNVTFPELGNLFLRNVASGKPDMKAVVTVPNHDALQRFASSVEQIAELNQYAQALILEEVGAAKQAPTTDSKAPTPERTQGVKATASKAAASKADGAGEAKAAENEKGD